MQTEPPKFTVGLLDSGEIVVVKVIRTENR